MGANCDMYHSLSRDLREPGMLLHPQLQDAGYRCGFVGKWHVGADKGPADYGFEGMSIPGYGNIRGHQAYQDYLTERGLAYEIRPSIYLNPGDATMSVGVWDGPTESTPPDFLADYTIDMLDSYAGGDRPFFITCNFWGPHAPFLPSNEYYGSHDRDAIPPWDNYEDTLEDKPVRVRHERNDFYRRRPATWEDWQEVIGLAFDFTSMIDAQIGRILDRVEALSIRDETAVVLTSDHGDMLGSHNQLFDKGFISEEAHHIPLVISAPGVPGVAAGGVTCDDLVSNMDLMPTTLELCGLASSASSGADGPLDGRSLLPALDGDESRQPRDRFLLEFHGIRYLYSERAIVTVDGWKYVFNPGDTDEVYHLETDAAEMNNLIESAEQGEVIERLQRELMAAVVEARDPIRGAVYKLLGHFDDDTWKN